MLQRNGFTILLVHQSGQDCPNLITTKCTTILTMELDISIKY